MRADLHIHSVWSDGTLTPAELARRARDAGLSLFSLTDHDSMEGSAEAADAARRCGLGFVRGWEISAYDGDAKVHVLGYGCQMGERYLSFLSERREAAERRAKLSIDLANDYLGLDVTFDEAEAYHVRKDAPIHTMHVVRAFAARLKREEGRLYNEVFGFGGPAFTRLCRPTPEEAVGVIRDMGGVSVLAHPGRIFDFTPEEFRLFRGTDDPKVKRRLLLVNGERRDALMDRLTACGLGGIECYYPTHTVTETAYFLGYAREHGLFATGGSDFHGAEQAIGEPFFDAAEIADTLRRLDGSV